MVPPKQSSREPKAMVYLLHSHYGNCVWFKELLLPASPRAVRVLSAWHHGGYRQAQACRRQEVSGKAGSSPSCWWGGF